MLQEEQEHSRPASSSPALAFPKTNTHHATPVFSEDMTRVRTAIMSRDGYCCRVPWCDAVHFLEMSHTIPRSLGGNTSSRNCLTLCAEHHRGRLSMHAGNLKCEFLTPVGCDGPVEFRVVSIVP